MLVYNKVKLTIGGGIMQILKEDIIKLVSNLPDKFDVEDFMYKLHVLDKVKKGQKDIRKGNFIAADELRSEIGKW